MTVTWIVTLGTHGRLLVTFDDPSRWAGRPFMLTGQAALDAIAGKDLSRCTMEKDPGGAVLVSELSAADIQARDTAEDAAALARMKAGANRYMAAIYDAVKYAAEGIYLPQLKAIYGDAEGQAVHDACYEYLLGLYAASRNAQAATTVQGVVAALPLPPGSDPGCPAHIRLGLNGKNCPTQKPGL